jgi:hypothetical protein
VTVFEVCLGGDLYGDRVVIVWAASRREAIAAAGAAVRKHDTDIDFVACKDDPPLELFVRYVKTHESGEPIVIEMGE